VLQELTPVKAAMVMVNEHEDGMVMLDAHEDVLMVGEIINTDVAMQLNTYINEIKPIGAYIGMFAFVILALMRRVRVFLWCGLERKDIIE